MSTQAFYNRFKYWTALYSKENILVELESNKLPDDTKCLHDICVRISRKGSSDGFATTTIHFSNDGVYRISHDKAPFTRTQINDAIEFALHTIPEIFPHVELSDAYPTETH